LGLEEDEGGSSPGQSDSYPGSSHSEQTEQELEGWARVETERDHSERMELYERSKQTELGKEVTRSVGQEGAAPSDRQQIAAPSDETEEWVENTGPCEFAFNLW
jgi:hypothetical protein